MYVCAFMKMTYVINEDKLPPNPHGLGGSILDHEMLDMSE